MVLLEFDATQWENLLTRLEDGQLMLATGLEDLQGQLATISSLQAESLVVLRQIRDKLPVV